LAITSLAFMLVEVPAPPWITSTTNSSSSAPERISSQARMIAPAREGSSSPSSRFAVAAACLTQASARMRSGYAEIGVPEIGKFSSARTVCTP